MSNSIIVLKVLLYDQPIGLLTHLPGDRNSFTFDEEYIENTNRPTLSLSFKDKVGNLITEIKSTRTRLPPFFSNLLPEGQLKDYLASRAHVDEEKEFFLLSVLGNDLPGAISIQLTSNHQQAEQVILNDRKKSDKIDGPLRFSLAGVQLKFSAIKKANKGLTIPTEGIGGSWIVKIPSNEFQGVPENEYTMMELARKIGIDIPETMLLPINDIEGLPKGIERLGPYAYAIKRFDRMNNKKIHIEDFAQVFNVYPEKKYKSASYRNIAEVIRNEIGEKGIIEFIRRFVFNVLIGNGDMHLKNWSLIYLDQRKAQLTPAYDFVSTIPYIPNETLALKFVDSNEFQSLDWEQFKRFANKLHIPENLILSTVKETVQGFF